MENAGISIVITLLDLGIAGVAFWDYRKRKNLWLLLSLIVGILAAAVAWLAVVNAGFLTVPALALLGLGLWSNRRA
ncbi:MAG: hypothetical protein N2049_09780 [Anaerolineales bacterium]|nr:hypothetical protein [Anaerolineales bacterium]MCX7609492.1 hypothetical protein [Anaerolineales bacterium]MDW8227978.1 hypothetical protein [Anaerolineales bacterium]